MTDFYPLITIVSMVLFGWLGRSLATSKNRHAMGWLLSGAVFPPLLLILIVLSEVSPQESDGAGDGVTER